MTISEILIALFFAVLILFGFLAQAGENSAAGTASASVEIVPGDDLEVLEDGGLYSGRGQSDGMTVHFE